jgi:hypothetical protein
MGLVCEEVFSKIQARLDKIDPNNRKVVAVFKIKIKQNDEVVKVMMLDLVAVKFYEGDDAAECTIALDDQLLADIVNRKVDAMDALNKDLIDADGNLELLHVLKEQISANDA